MDWLALRRDTRRVMHQTFSSDARYAFAAGGDSIIVSARRDIDIDRYGDLDREGYAQVLTGVSRIGLLRSEIEQPRRGDVVTFLEDGLSFRVENIEPATDDLTWICEVVEV